MAIDKEYLDHGVSGAKGRDERPAFDQTFQDPVRHKVDIIAGVSVDRLGRSLQDLVAFLAEIKELAKRVFQMGALDPLIGEASYTQLRRAEPLRHFAQLQRSLIETQERAMARRSPGSFAS